ncbi:MAG: phenylalanine--tRNA ligase beta subunit-related protein, partial [Patescibacteria group bacterium]|nr:phenylalanine--tRNA ligase beta subunit-related protein [Patescibacteria group bacterium]
CIQAGDLPKIDENTREIIIESANFNPILIYKTSKAIKLATDASQRFGHGLSPELCKTGIDRATLLLKEICGAVLVDSKDVYPKPQSRRILKFDFEKMASVLGTDIDSKAALAVLRILGFRVLPKNMIEIPASRLDVNIIEDLIEEVGRMHDLNKIPAKNPRVLLAPPEMDENFVSMEKAKNSLVRSGFSEVRNSSFVPDKSAGDVELENPLSDDKRFLRNNLVYHLRENIKANHRFAGTVKIFEIGKVFLGGLKEERHLAAAVSVKSGDHVFRDLRGVAEELLRNLGLTDYSFVPEGDKLRLESDHDVLGYLRAEPRNRAAFLEINFDKAHHLVEGEMEYLPISPYPSILRDISFTVKEGTKVNLILEAIADLRLPDLEDVDLVDYLPPEAAGEGLIGLTLRLVFQSMKRTLSDEEANRATAKIENVLTANFNAQIR